MAFNVSYIYTLKDKVSQTAKRVRVNFRLIDKEIGRAASRIEKFNKKIKNFKKVGRDLSTKVSLPVAAAGTAAALMFGKFEEGLGNTLTLLDSTAPEGFAKRLEGIAKGGIRAGFSIEDTNKALFDSVSALGANNFALKAFRTAQKLARGGAASLSVSVDGITSIMNAYGKETTIASNIANAFFSAQKGGKTTVAALASNVGKVVPSAQAAGIGFKKLLATMAQLTLGGLSTEMATTGLRGAINSLVKPSKEAEELLRKHGIASNAVQLRSQGLTKTLSKLAAIAKKNPNLISKMIPEQEARVAIDALTKTGAIANLQKIVSNINKDIKEGTGLTDAFAKKNAEMNTTIAKAAGNLKIMAVTAGAIMAPAITRLANIIALASQKFTEFAQQHPKLTKFGLVILGVVAAVGPLIVAVGLMGAMFAAFSVAAALVAAKVALIGLAVAGVIAFWDDLKIAMENVLNFWSGGFINGLKEAASIVGGLLGGGDIGINGGGVAAQTMTSNARLDGQITVNAPPGTVRSVESKMTGAPIGDLGLGLAG
jgi:TP901 family phage tail tape measure protein